MTDLKAMMRESREREREYERKRKAATCYGIFPHAIDGRPTGRGHVVRPIDCQTKKAHDARNYGSLTPKKTYKLRSAADKAVEREYPL